MTDPERAEPYPPLTGWFFVAMGWMETLLYLSGNGSRSWAATDFMLGLAATVGNVLGDIQNRRKAKG